MSTLGGVDTRATDFGSRGLLSRGLHFSFPHSSDGSSISPSIQLGVYTLLVYTLRVHNRATDFRSRRPPIGLGVYTRAADFGCRHPLIGRIHAAGLHFGCPHSNDRYCISPPIQVGFYTLAIYTLRVYTRATNFKSRHPLIGLAVNALEVCTTASGSLHHSLGWGSTL